jgi:tRNA 5-methylaminomethyl-2-thiouridine biosynthesis bifunctional protein
MAEPVLWTPDGAAHSARFGDVYCSRAGGLAQALGVFLQGCGLPRRWRGQPRFTVLETGFGLGLNFLATWAAWRRDAQRCGQLRYVSVEAYPVAAQDLLHGVEALEAANGQAAALLPEVRQLAAALASSWRDMAPGLHQRVFDAGQVLLTLAVNPVQPALASLPRCEADALYLDGFSPACNPDMWSLPTLAVAARHCRPDCRAASYTVAAPVRQTLQQLGFEVSKCPGLPPKRHRLEARLVAPPR